MNGTSNTINTENQVFLYQAEDGQFKVDVRFKDETVWLTQKQMGELFSVETNTINYHLKSIFKSGELQENAVIRIFRITAADGKIYETNAYNLDAIISVGYRVNSVRATQFRIWATRTLKEHLLQGYTVNQKRLTETGLTALENALQLFKSASSRLEEITNQEVQGLLEVITHYAKSWFLLRRYDENCLPTPEGKAPFFCLGYKTALKVIAKLKSELTAKNEATEIFGHEREQGLHAILGNLEQSFGGQDLYPTLEAKAAHLLYFIIKDHPFLDGNKRIASLLFIFYLDQNGRLRKANGETIINDNALVALALLIAESDPKSKELMVQLVENLLGEIANYEQ